MRQNGFLETVFSLSIILIFVGYVLYSRRDELKKLGIIGGGIKGLLKALVIIILTIIVLIIIGLITVWLSFHLLDFFRVLF